MKRHGQRIGLGLVMSVGMGFGWTLPSWAADQPTVRRAGDIQQDQQDLRHDTRDLKNDQRDLTKDERKPGNASSATNAVQGPLPPGLEKQGKVPEGLEKQGKTPHGWSRGKAWWKHGGQPPQGVHPMGNGGVFGGEHAGHSTVGHGRP